MQTEKSLVFVHMIAATAVLLLLAVVLYIIIDHFTRRIEILNKSIGILGSGDLSHRVEIKSKDELGRLAGSFNFMAENLQKVTVSKEYMDNIIETMIDPLVVLDPDARIRKVNRTACDLLECDEKELFGRPFELLFPNVDAIPFKVTELEDVIEIKNHETEYRTRNGRTLSILLSASTMKDKNDAVIHIVSTAKDITERKRAETQLQRAKEEWERTFDAIDDIIILLDEQRRVSRINRAAAKIFSSQQEDLVDKHCYQIFQKRSEPCPECPVTRTFHDHRSHSGEIEHAHIGKRLFVSASLIFDRDGNFAGVVHIGKDVTEERKLRKQLQHAQKMEAVGTLAGGIAHDFNNLLQAVQGYAQLLMLDRKEGEPGHEELQEIVRAAVRGSELTRQLLTFSRKVESKRQPLDLNHQVREVRRLLERTIPKTIEIRLRLAAALETVNADPLQVEQILMNLAVNAKDAMPEGGRLVIETENVTLDEQYCKRHLGARPGDYVLLSISDTGAGIDRQTRERIFEPFFSTKETGKGTGLGLAIVYGIVKGHHGCIQCDSEPGAGTTFRIYLPVLKREEKTVDYREAEGGPVPGGRETILLVDDEESIRALGERVLKKIWLIRCWRLRTESRLCRFTALDHSGLEDILSDGFLIKIML